MNNLAHKLQNKNLRKRRIRSQVSGVSTRPRLSVYISNRNVSAQIIDDSKQLTVAYVTSTGAKIEAKTLTQKAEWVGSQIGKKAIAAKIKQVVFDRGGRLYHGRVKVLADKAREAGLEF